ncbi:MAG: saccharopine dehydrogenase C-terminal domain-containing protein [Planctomycetota bacterium]
MPREAAMKDQSKDIVLLGAGKIGSMVAHLLCTSGDYRLRVGDASMAQVERIARKYPQADGGQVDFADARGLDRLMQGGYAVISCAPFRCNPLIAERAKVSGLHYLDLTEDVAVTGQVMELASGAPTAFIPQCGLAPGFITIIAFHLIKSMTDVTDLRLRVGALPRYPSNMLKYNLTWSTEGLINEYCQPCEVVLNGALEHLQPLENLEHIAIDGVEYEAFNTSGGLGTLADTLRGKVRNVNYKSLRYPGHNHLIKFLLHDLQMQGQQKLLQEIFDRCLPATLQDQIVIFVSATGKWHGRLIENTYARTVYHQVIDGEDWSGIQITTAAGVCAVLDLLAAGKLPSAGFVRQEQVDYDAFIGNRFGKYYA